MIEVENVVKVYRRCSGILRRRCQEVKALDGVSFKIKRGEIAGIIGPNGSGKSTLMKILTGILKPTSGSAKVLDFVPWESREELAKHIGVVFGGRTSLLPYVPVYDNLAFLCSLYGVEKKRIDELAGAFGIENLLDAVPVKLSLGQRMRVELVAALLHDPEVIFLDEPTIGLDIIAKELLLNLLRDFSKDKAVIFISHDLGEVEELCSRIIILNRGRKVFDGSIADLKGIVDYKICRIITEKPVKGKYLHVFRIRGGIEKVIARFSPFGIRDLEVFSPPIEEVVSRFYGEGDDEGD